MYKYFLGIRFLLFRPVNLLGVFGVALSVWALILVVSIFSGFIREVRQHIRGASSDVILHGVAPEYSFSEAEGGREQSISEIIKSNPHVVAAAPRVIMPALLLSENCRHQLATSRFSTRSQVVAKGIDPKLEERATNFRSYLDLESSSLAVDDPDHPFRLKTESGFGRQRDGILLSKMYTQSYYKGNRISLVTMNLFAENLLIDDLDKKGSQVLIKKNLDISGFFESRFHQHEQVTVYTHINTTRKMLGFDPLEDEYKDVFNEVAIKLDDPLQAMAVLNDLRPKLELVIAKPWALETWEQRKKPLLQAVDHERGLMKLILWIIQAVAMFLILATLSMMVTEKTRDIGVISALGATKTGVVYIFLFCSFVISVIGATLGLISGWLSCLYLNDFNQFLLDNFDLELFPRQIYNLTEIPYELEPLWMVKVFFIAVVAALIFALIPAWRASRFEPVKALRYE